MRGEAGHHSTDDVLQALHAVTTDSHARSLIARAARVAGVRRGSRLDADQLLMLCSALAAEGGHIEQIAVALAQRALDEPTRGGGRQPRP